MSDGATDLPAKLDMILAADISEVARMLDAVEEFGAAHALPPKTVLRLNLVLDELVTNIVSHGLEGSGDSDVRLTVLLEDGTLDVELIDNGKPFDPLAAELPEPAAGLDERAVGGIGLKFVRTYADRLDYRHDGEFNRLHLQLDVNQADRPPDGGFE